MQPHRYRHAAIARSHSRAKNASNVTICMLHSCVATHNTCGPADNGVRFARPLEGCSLTRCAASACSSLLSSRTLFGLAPSILFGHCGHVVSLLPLPKTSLRHGHKGVLLRGTPRLNAGPSFCIIAEAERFRAIACTTLTRASHRDVSTSSLTCTTSNEWDAPAGFSYRDRQTATHKQLQAATSSHKPPQTDTDRH